MCRSVSGFRVIDLKNDLFPAYSGSMPEKIILFVPAYLGLTRNPNRTCEVSG